MNHDYYVGLIRQQQSDSSDVENITAYYHLQATIEDDEKIQAQKLRTSWQEKRLEHTTIRTDNIALWKHIAIPIVDIAVFPRYTFSIQFPFRLTKAYLSKDERDFYIIDNPIRRDKVYRLPYVAPSTWKGSLRSSIWKIGYDERHESVQRLFGNEKGEEDDFRAGRLRFYPTFFTEHGLEIINPHDRKRKVGKNPILFESVPPGTPGLFTLLYVPFDQVGQDEKETRRQTAQDLQILADGVQAMFVTYGFGAKTSNGYGTAVENFIDRITRQKENLPPGMMQLKAVLNTPNILRELNKKTGFDFDEITSEEWESLIETDEVMELYQKSREANNRHQLNIETGQVSEEIESFDEMVGRLGNWANALQEEASDE